MWNDNETPGCFYDQTDCTGDCCEEGRLMYDRYLDEKYLSEEEKLSEKRKAKLERILNND